MGKGQFDSKNVSNLNRKDFSVALSNWILEKNQVTENFRNVPGSIETVTDMRRILFAISTAPVDLFKI